VTEYPTPIGTMRLETNWPALELAVRKRCGWGAAPARTITVEATRGGERPDWNGALEVMDALVLCEPDHIQAWIPDPSFMAGAVLDWLWLAVARFCKPDGWLFLHAAAVAHEGAVTLIAGESGSGKTTVLLAMLDAGAQYLSDDAVLLDPGTGMVYPWSREFHLLPEQMAERWPELLGETLDFNGKVRISPQALGHDASDGGMLRRIVLLADKGEAVNLSHRGVGIDEGFGIDVLGDRWKIECWGSKPADLRERVGRAVLPACPSMAVLTPFSGKAWVLGEWLESFLRQGIPAGAHLLWLCNSQDEAFWAALHEAAAVVRATHPNLQLWRDTHRVGVKDRQVAYLWQQMRTRVPEKIEMLLALEDDVLPDEGAFAALLGEWQRRAGRDMVGIPVAHTYMHGEATALAWVYEAAGPTTDPRFIVAQGVAGKEAMPGSGPQRVGGLSFSCALIPRDQFDAASLAPPGDSYVAGGYDHQFCIEMAERGREVVAYWGLGASHLKQESGTVRAVRLHRREVLLVGSGPDVGDGTRYEIKGRCAEHELAGRACDAHFALICSPSLALTPAYVDALVDHLTWHPAAALVWGYRRRSDSRMVPGWGPGALVRLSACREAREGNVEGLRRWLATEGWQEHHTDRACCLDLGPPDSLGYQAVSDPRREVAAFRVLMLNRDRWRGSWPGFGGDFTQIEGYRRGLRALGIYADLRGGQFWWHDGYQLIHLHHHQYDWAWEAAETCDGKRPVVLSAITHRYPTRDIMGRAIGLADYIVCYSESEAAFIAERFPEKKARLRVVPMGVDPVLFSPNGQVEASASVFMAGKVCGYKGQIAVLEACKRLDLPIRFAGFNEDPVHDPYCDEFLRAVERYDGAEFLGFLRGDELWDEYRRAHLHVNASQFEPFGQVTLDALALGCNIVHSRRSWAAEQFGRVGSLCEPDDVDSIAAAIDTEMKRRRGWANVRPPSYPEAAQSLAAVYWEALQRG